VFEVREAILLARNLAGMSFTAASISASSPAAVLIRSAATCETRCRIELTGLRAKNRLGQ